MSKPQKEEKYHEVSLEEQRKIVEVYNSLKNLTVLAPKNTEEFQLNLHTLIKNSYILLKN